MTSRTSFAALLVVLVALFACKKKEEQALPDAALPAPLPETPATTAPAATASAPTEAEDEADPKPVGTTSKPTAKKDGGTTAKTDAGTTAKTDAGSTSTASKACFEKCSAVLQGCLTPAKKDGGFPSLGDPAKCQAAFKDCQTACK